MELLQIRNLLNTRQVLQEILIMLVLKMVMMQTKLAKIKLVVIPLKHLSNFWRALNIPVINCEVELIDLV